MKFQTGRCTNYSSCKLAYRGEKINAPANAFRCPECGSALELVRSTHHASLNRWLVVVVSLALVFTVGAVLYGFWYFSQLRARDWMPTVVAVPTPSATPTPTPSPTPTPTPILQAPTPFPLLNLTPTPSPTVTPTPIQVATPEPKRLAFNLTEEEFAKLKEEVVQRIELMPELTAAQKQNLYLALNRAQGMHLLYKVEFPTGQIRVNTSDEEAIRRALEQPVIAKALEDPLLVFVILGYASQTGTSETNLRISRARADFIADFLIKKIQVKNVIYPVPMGASTLFGKDRPHANQAAEIWLVVP